MVTLSRERGGDEGKGDGEKEMGRGASAWVMRTLRRRAFIAGDEAVWPSKPPPWESGGVVAAINGSAVTGAHSLMINGGVNMHVRAAPRFKAIRGARFVARGGRC